MQVLSKEVSTTTSQILRLFSDNTTLDNFHSIIVNNYTAHESMEKYDLTRKKFYCRLQTMKKLWLAALAASLI